MVYFIAGGGKTKIGKTNDLSRRLTELNVGSPVRLRLVHSVPGSTALEQRVFNVLATDGRHSHGEWFHGEVTRDEAAEIVESALARGPVSGRPAHELYGPRTAVSDAYGDRPDCECHGEPMRWSMSSRYRAGGIWRCAVKSRQATRKYGGHRPQPRFADEA